MPKYPEIYNPQKGYVHPQFRGEDPRKHPREMDILVAERVLGYHDVYLTDEYDYGEGLELRGRVTIDGTYRCMIEDNHYSTNLEHCLAMVRSLQEKEPSFKPASEDPMEICIEALNHLGFVLK